MTTPHTVRMATRLAWASLLAVIATASLLLTGCAGGLGVGIGIGIPVGIPGVSIGVGVNQNGQVSAGAGVGVSKNVGGASVGVGVGKGAVIYDPNDPKSTKKPAEIAP